MGESARQIPGPFRIQAVGGQMADTKRQKARRKPAEAPFAVSLEYEPSEDAEDRLLRAYELLLGVPETPEIDLEVQK